MLSHGSARPPQSCNPEADAEAKPEPSDTWIVAKLPRKINYLFQLH